MCEHGFIGACAECDGCGQQPEPEVTHPIGCLCGDCQVQFERESQHDARDFARTE